MDTTAIIIIVVALAIIITLRLALRSYRLRQASSENREPTEPASSLEKTTTTAECTSSEIEARVERLEETHLLDKATPTAGHTPTQADTGLEKAVEISHLHKSFGGNEVVNDVSFSLTTGEVFGLVGPNGAGKTTTIRMLMDIIRPDSGEIRLFGQPLEEDTKNRIGYLPEERGLYRRMTVSDSLVYLASLKNME
ncbi:MAG: ATP-binding cassette domain-containing protein, partial [Dehalococcoidia bacterium]|nr:ATP-binding cassette domain-containing protein [Dehalococcoidia bacterium]